MHDKTKNMFVTPETRKRLALEKINRNLQSYDAVINALFEEIRVSKGEGIKES